MFPITLKKELNGPDFIAEIESKIDGPVHSYILDVLILFDDCSLLNEQGKKALYLLSEEWAEVLHG